MPFYFMTNKSQNFCNELRGPKLPRCHFHPETLPKKTLTSRALFLLFLYSHCSGQTAILARTFQTGFSLKGFVHLPGMFSSTILQRSVSHLFPNLLQWGLLGGVFQWLSNYSANFFLVCTIPPTCFNVLLSSFLLTHHDYALPIYHNDYFSPLFGS